MTYDTSQYRELGTGETVRNGDFVIPDEAMGEVDPVPVARSEVGTLVNEWKDRVFLRPLEYNYQGFSGTFPVDNIEDDSPVHDALAGYQQVVWGMAKLLPGDLLVLGNLVEAYQPGHHLVNDVAQAEGAGYRVYRKGNPPKPVDDKPTVQESVMESFDEMAAARKLVLGDRNASYGNPADDYKKTSKLWSGILAGKLTRDITPEEAVLMMVALKLSRLVHSPKADSRVDAHGYLLCHQWMTTGEVPS